MTCVETLTVHVIWGGSWIFGHRKLVGGGVSWKGTGGYKFLHCSPVPHSLWDGQRCSTVRVHHVALLQHSLKVVETLDQEHTQLKLWTKIEASSLYVSHLRHLSQRQQVQSQISFLPCLFPTTDMLSVDWRKHLHE